MRKKGISWVLQVEIICDRQNGAVCGQTPLCKAEGCNELHRQYESPLDLLPLALECVHIRAIEVVNFETDAADIAQHKTGLQDEVFRERKPSANAVEFVDQIMNLFSGVVNGPLRHRDR